MYIKSPNLPESAVTNAIVDKNLPLEIKSELISCGINLISTEPFQNLDSPVSSHPDMQFIHLGENRLICNDISKKYFDSIGNADIIISDIMQNNKYPKDIVFNVCIISKNAVLYAKNEISKYLSDFNLIKVKQGYAKCSILPVSTNSLITDDESIINSLDKSNFEALLVKKGDIYIKGYNYGFIGGCGGKIDKDKIAFYGDIKKHSSYNEIKDFLGNYGINAISLSDAPLSDYGSLVPITEEGI